MGSRQFTQQQKLSVLKAAEDVGVKESARVAGVHYVTVYEWRRQLESLGEEAFLAKDVHRPGRGVKEVSQEQELVHGCSLEDADRRR
ncbi:MAG: helix-turn-helix domain-containing protein [Desulfovibrionales bacterium]|nr:MAG: helix-turn-helix domain-containing protein [Desulfovibrionales bacterium]